MSELTFSADGITRRMALRDDPVTRFERMLEIRRMEERINVLFGEGRVHGTTHLALGQEALAVALATVLETDDHVTGTYRGHALALALGMTPKQVLGEIMGRKQGGTGGVGGSMHLCDMTLGLLPTFAIVGAGLPVAAGSALAFQTRGEPRVAVAVFGDGATNIGAFHEALNLAAIWNLPIVFVCDNNLYGEYSRIDRTTPFEDLRRRAEAYGIRSTSVDGMNLEAVQTELGAAVAQARAGEGPRFVEAKTYRFAGHSRADTAPYRPEGELEQWRLKDPIDQARTWLLQSGFADEARLDAMEAELATAIDQLVESVEGSEAPEVAAMFRNIGVAPAR